MVTILLLSACNPPRDRRVTRNEQYVIRSNDGESEQTSGNSTVTDDGGDEQSSSNSDSSSTTNVNPGMENCNFATSSDNQYHFTHSHLGASNGYNICQNTQDPKKVHLQLKSAISDAKVCIIPTSNRNGLTVFIGEPRCLMMSEASKIEEIPLLINRTGFETLSINGVMIIRDKSYFYGWPYNQYLLAPDAFVFCSQWLDNYSDPSYCNTFNAVGEYIYHQF
ncbi:MAG: hypothetical protein HN730_02635 [Bdellovibrionales bacterium]|nr:hypothetical protein [Bdellovibrionales bacterium]